MKLGLCLPFASLLALSVATGCGGRSSLDTFEAAVPAPPDLGGDADLAQVGDACDGPDTCDRLDCEGTVPLFGTNVTFPEGYCTAVGCREEADCGPGADCVSSLDERACLKVCESDFDCRIGDGYVCTTVGSVRADTTYCVPGT